MLSKPEILGAIRRGEMAITPFDASSVGPVSVDLRLGSEFKTFRKPASAIAVKDDDAAFPASATNSVSLKNGQPLRLKPGEFALGVTAERVRLSGHIAAKIEGRSRFARLGLMVHVSSSLVQPGVDNVQVLEIVNLSPAEIELWPGTKICQLVFERLERPAKYEGRFRKQTKP